MLLCIFITFILQCLVVIIVVVPNIKICKNKIPKKIPTCQARQYHPLDNLKPCDIDDSSPHVEATPPFSGSLYPHLFCQRLAYKEPQSVKIVKGQESSCLDTNEQVLLPHQSVTPLDGSPKKQNLEVSTSAVNSQNEYGSTNKRQKRKVGPQSLFAINNGKKKTGKFQLLPQFYV